MNNQLILNMIADNLEFMYSKNFTKEKAIETGTDLAESVLDDGFVDPKKVLSNLVRLRAVIDSAVLVLRDEIGFIVKDSFNGVEFNPVNPKESFVYEEDDICAKLSAQLKERQDLVKLASKSKDVIFDSTGAEVSKVSSKFSKSSITIKF